VNYFSLPHRVSFAMRPCRHSILAKGVWH